LPLLRKFLRGFLTSALGHDRNVMAIRTGAHAGNMAQQSQFGYVAQPALCDMTRMRITPRLRSQQGRSGERRKLSIVGEYQHGSKSCGEMQHPR
jgi:hypothetical protein